MIAGADASCDYATLKGTVQERSCEIDFACYLRHGRKQVQK